MGWHKSGGREGGEGGEGGGRCGGGVGGGGEGGGAGGGQGGGLGVGDGGGGMLGGGGGEGGGGEKPPGGAGESGGSGGGASGGRMGSGGCGSGGTGGGLLGGGGYGGSGGGGGGGSGGVIARGSCVIATEDAAMPRLAAMLPVSAVSSIVESMSSVASASVPSWVTSIWTSVACTATVAESDAGSAPVADASATVSTDRPVRGSLALREAWMEKTAAPCCRCRACRCAFRISSARRRMLEPAVPQSRPFAASPAETEHVKR